MTATVVWLDGRRETLHPAPGVGRVEVKAPCVCGAVLVTGNGPHQRNHDTYDSIAACVGCGVIRGRLEAQVSTIFGIEEDEAVLGGRCRVY